MKHKLIAVTTLIFSAAFAQSQTQPAQPADPDQGQVQPAQPVVPDRSLPTPTQPGAVGQEGSVFNQPAGITQPPQSRFRTNPNPRFGGTNQTRFGGTNQVRFGGTNRLNFGSNNVVFGTNAAGATNAGAVNAEQLQVINEAAGAATNQAAQTGANVADQAFALQLRTALAQTGATQIYFPQTRSTVTVMNQGGTVTLQGAVSSEAERESIEARIKNTPGVVSVDNQLQIGADQNRVLTPRTPGINPAPNSETDRRLLNP